MICVFKKQKDVALGRKKVRDSRYSCYAIAYKKLHGM